MSSKIISSNKSPSQISNTSLFTTKEEGKYHKSYHEKHHVRGFNENGPARYAFISHRTNRSIASTKYRRIDITEYKRSWSP